VNRSMQRSIANQTYFAGILFLGLLLVTAVGCGRSAIDVDLAAEMILSENGAIKDDAIELLTEKFGSPYAPSPAQVDKMRTNDAIFLGKMKGRKKDYSGYKVWGNDTAFIALFFNGSSKNWFRCGGTPKAVPVPN